VVEGTTRWSGTEEGRSMEEQEGSARGGFDARRREQATSGRGGGSSMVAWCLQGQKNRAIAGKPSSAGESGARETSHGEGRGTAERAARESRVAEERRAAEGVTRGVAERRRG